MRSNTVVASAYRALAKLCLASALSLPAWADTGDMAQAGTVRQLYEQFGTLWCSEREMARVFDAAFARDMATACDRDLIMAIGMPAIPGNDYDLGEITRTLDITCDSGQEARCVARFQSFGQPTTVTYRLGRQGGRWVITDIIDDRGDSYRRAVSQAL